MEKEKILKRETYLAKIRPFYDTNYIKVITGIRRCGKSMILQQIMDEIYTLENSDISKIIYIDLESPKYSHIRYARQLFPIINRFVKNLPKNTKLYIFIDEIQKINKFEEVIAAIRVGYNCSLFVTGSNSKLLHGKLQDRLTGRAKEFEILPFTYSESLEYKKLNNIDISDNDFEEYLKWGGMPQRFLEVSDEGRYEYLEGLFNSIVKKDIFDNYKLINKLRFDRVSKFILSLSGCTFSGLSLAKAMKKELNIKNEKPLSKVINGYVDHLTECYLIQECYQYNFTSKKSVTGFRKLYPMDVGFKTTLSNTNEYNKTFALESVIYNELIFRGYKISYCKTNTADVDFVVTKGGKKCFIQVAYLITNDSTYKREFGSLKTVRSNCPKFVLSLDNKLDSDDGITHINILKFLRHEIDIYLS